MIKPTTLELVFGALVPPIAEQLKNVGLIAKKQRIYHWQIQADAITKLSIAQLLPPSQVREARMRLLRKICKEVNPKEQP